MSTVTLRERRQITLAAEVVAAVGIRVNDEFDVRVVNSVIQMAPQVDTGPQRPAMSRFLGAAAGLYGRSAEEADAYVRQQRDSWQAMLDVSSLLARLGGGRLYFDTNLFIHVLNDTPGFAAMGLLLLEAYAERRIVGPTGDVTLAELLVKPLQANDAAAVAAVKELLVHDGAITLVSHDRAAFERAAQHRARHGLKMVDALQLATAQRAGARGLISNDRQFPPLPDIECLSLTG